MFRSCSAVATRVRVDGLGLCKATHNHTFHAILLNDTPQKHRYDMSIQTEMNYYSYMF